MDLLDFLEIINDLPDRYIIAAHSEWKESRSRIAHRRTLLLAAVIAALLALSACGYTVFRLYQNADLMLEAAFGDQNGSWTESTPSLEQTESSDFPITQTHRVPLNKELADTLVAPYLCAVEQKYEYGNYKLNVEAYTYDEGTHAGLVYYSIQNLNGITGYKVEPTGEVWWPQGEIVIFGHIRCRSYIVPDLSDENKLTCIGYFYHFIHEKDETGHEPQTELYVKLNIDFIDGDSKPLSNIRDYPGAVLPLKNFAGSLSPVVHAEYDKGSILLSPYSLRYSKSFCEAETGERGSSFDSICIAFQDETEYVVMTPDTVNYTVYAGEGDSAPNSGSTICFNRVIDPQNAVSVILNGQKYNLQKVK